MPALPGLPRLQAGPTPQGRRASAADFGALEGQAREQRAGIFGQVGQAAGEVVDIHTRIRDAANQAKLARAAAEYGAELDRTVLDLETDPDLDTHEERIGKASKDLLKRHQQALPPELHGALENRVFPSTANAQLEVVRSTNKRRIRDSVANADEMLRLSTDQAARAADPVRRGQIRGQAVGALEGLRAAGILDQAGYDERVQRLEKGIAEADLLAALEADPAGAYKELGDPASALAAGRSEAERLKARADALRAFEHQLSERRAAASFAQSQADRADRDADDEADQRALDLLSGGDLPGLQQHLAATRGVLSRDRRQFYLDRIASGGGLSDSAGGGTNPGAYVDLSNRAAAGQLERGEIDEAFRGGLISKADRDKLVESAGDRRFNTAEKLLSDSLQQSPFKFDTKTQARNAEAKRAFAEFRATNPKASEAEALAYARELIRYSGLQYLANALPPRFGAPAASGQFDAATATAAAMAAFEAGQLTEDALDEELQRIEAMEDAQKRAGATK
jgi:hypothetical protein